MKPSEYAQRGWCQGASAKDDTGCVVDPQSPHAVAWCMYGAVLAAYPHDAVKRGQIYDQLDPIINTSIGAYNDDCRRTQADVVKVLLSIGE